MDSDKVREIALTARIAEANNLGERLRDNMKTIDSANSVGITIITAGVSFGVAQDKPIVIVLMPFVLLLVVVHVVQTFTELLMMGGQRRCLEEKLRAELGRHALFSETVIAPLRVNARDLAMKQGLYGIALIALTGFGIWYARAELPGVGQAAYVIALGYGLVTLVYSIVVMAGAYDAAYDAARLALDADEAPGLP